MPENEGFKKTYAVYDRMSTESLLATLELEARLGRNGVLDPDAIAYIAEVIAKREEVAQSLPDLQAAWETFQKDYLSCPGIGSTLYDFDGDNYETAGDSCIGQQIDGKRIDLCSALETKKGQPAKKPHKKFSMLGRIVAAVAVLLLAGSITAHAFNTSLTRVVGQWFASCFNLVALGDVEPSSMIVRPSNPAATYASLGDALAAYQVTVPLAPAWIPDGYIPSGVTVDDDSVRVCFTATYENQSHEEIVITVSEIIDFNNLKTYEKDSKEVLVYESSGVKHYLMGNNSDLRATWINESFECKISGNISGTDLQRMIESIYMR